MKNKWTGTADRIFTLVDKDGNKEDRPAGHAEYRYYSSKETWGYIVFYVPHQLIDRMVKGHVPETLHVTYASTASDMSETWVGSVPLTALTCSEKLSFDYDVDRKYYSRKIEYPGYYQEDFEFRRPEDVFDGKEPPTTIFLRLCHTG